MTSKGESTKLDVAKLDERLLTRSSEAPPERADDDLLDPVYLAQVRRWREEQRLQLMNEWYAHHRRLSSNFRKLADRHDAEAEAIEASIVNRNGSNSKEGRS
jgi:hypothetical protein